MASTNDILTAILMFSSNYSKYTTGQNLIIDGGLTSKVNEKFKPNKIWNDALNLIPGGNGLLSKRPYRSVPNFWPTYYKKCNGILVTDLNGKKYIDFSAMGRDLLIGLFYQ